MKQMMMCVSYISRELQIIKKYRKLIGHMMMCIRCMSNYYLYDFS
jgi:hypothetical protein